MGEMTAKAALPACPVETTLTLIGDKWKVLIEKVPIFEPGNSGFKNGNFSFILGSRKELCFVLNRSFHVQLSMRSVTVVKFDILF